MNIMCFVDNKLLTTIYILCVIKISVSFNSNALVIPDINGSDNRYKMIL